MTSSRWTPSDSAELRARLGCNLKACRARVGISQYELALRAEAGLASVSPIELGQRMPRIDMFIRLVGSLGVTPNDLTAGILWVPGEVIVNPGSFEVPSNPALAAEVAALRASAHRRRGRTTGAEGP